MAQSDFFLSGASYLLDFYNNILKHYNCNELREDVLFPHLEDHLDEQLFFNNIMPQSMCLVKQRYGNHPT